MKTASSAIKAALKGHEPSDEQWAAIEHDPVALAIIAGAGSGKTAIMAARIVWMVEQGIAEPPKILALTFTNKACDELQERIAIAFSNMDSSPTDLPMVSTYNSFADRLVREHGVRIGIDSEVGLLSTPQSWQLVLNALDKVDAFDAIDSRSISSLCASCLSLSDQCDNHIVSPERVAEVDREVLAEPEYFDARTLAASSKRIELAGLVRAYKNAKQSADRIDYGDQIVKAVEIVEGFPEVAAAYRERYPTVLLDEYQDTNVAQKRLMRAIAPSGTNITAVGDARQNIFQWRGSTLFNLIDFPTKDFLRDGEVAHNYISLSTNFRSGANILEVANTLIDQVAPERRPGKPLTRHAPNGEGFVGVKLLADQTEEAVFIAQEIARLHGDATGPGREPCDWKDFAILVRRKSHMGPIYEALREADIPVEVVGLGGLLQIPEVMDTVAWLRVVADPGPPSNRWMARLLLGPRFRIHYRDLALLARWAAHRTLELTKAKKEGVPAQGRVVVPDETEFEPDDVAFSLAEALDHLDEIEGLGSQARGRLSQFLREVRSLRARTGGPLPDLVHRVIQETGIWEALESSPRKDAAAARANLTQFSGMVAKFAPVSGKPSLAEFLDYLDAAEDADETMELEISTAQDSVKLTTVHRAKGLEFEVVFVPGVAARLNDKGEKVDSVFPDTRTSNPLEAFAQIPYSAREDRDHLPMPWTIDASGKRVLRKKADFFQELKTRALEDERRLFYVALTRAKQRLYVTAAWWYERQNDERGPSVFFDEVASVPVTVNLGDAGKPEASPLRAQLAARAVWPPEPAERMPVHPEFSEGYAVVLDGLVAGETTAEEILERYDPELRTDAEAALAEHRRTISALQRPASRSNVAPSESPSTSVTRAVASISSPSDTRHRPLPERPSEARRIGMEIHSWIEELSRGLIGLADEEVLDQPGAHVDSSRLVDLRKTFEQMGFPERTLKRLDAGDPMAEVPFVLKVGERLVKGRIDAVYETPDGGIEIVDFKTGAKPGESSVELDQLLVYAGALMKLGLDVGKSIKLTYVYLADGTTQSREVSRAEAEQGLARLETGLSIAPA